MQLSPLKKSKVLKLIDKAIRLLEKCGGPGGTMGPCPSDGSGRGKVSKVSQEDFKDGGDSTEQMREIAASRVALNWKVDKDDLIALLKADGWKDDQIEKAEKSERGLKEAVAFSFIREWAGSSGGPVSAVAAIRVCEKLGIEHELFDRQKSYSKYFEDRPELNRAATSLGMAVYENTQEWLKKRGIEKVELLRAGGVSEERPFSSWSTDWGGVRHDPNRETVRSVIDSKYIWSTPATGFGTLSESEMVVLARPKGTTEKLPLKANAAANASTATERLESIDDKDPGRRVRDGN